MKNANEMEIIKIRGQEGRDYIKEKGYSHLNISDDGAFLINKSNKTKTVESPLYDDSKANVSKEAMIEIIEKHK